MTNLEKLRKLAIQPTLESWEGEVADEHLACCRAILREAAQALLSSAPQADDAKVSAAIAHAVEQLNIANAAGGEPFIYTIEREDLCDYLGQLGSAAGLKDEQIDAALAGRDW